MSMYYLLSLFRASTVVVAVLACLLTVRGGGYSATGVASVNNHHITKTVSSFCSISLKIF